MPDYERALQELTDFAKARGGGLEILFAGHHPAIFEVGGINVPFAWQCQVGNHQERFHAYGVTMRFAILTCHARWQSGTTGMQTEIPDQEILAMIGEKDRRQ